MPLWRQPEYTSVLEDEEDGERNTQHPPKQRRPSPQRYTLGMFHIGVVTLSSIVSFITGMLVINAQGYTANDKVSSALRTSGPESSAANTASPSFTHCGEDISTAQERGCRVDHMGGWWLPPLCYDSVLAIEMDEGRDGDHSRSLPTRFGIDKFSWFEDVNKSIPLLSLQDLESHLIAQGKNGETMNAITNLEHHTAHCAYASTVVGRAVIKLHNGESDVWVPEPLIRDEHPEHCEVLFGSPFLGRKGGGFGEMYTKIGFELSGCSKLTA